MFGVICLRIICLRTVSSYIICSGITYSQTTRSVIIYCVTIFPNYLFLNQLFAYRLIWDHVSVAILSWDSFSWVRMLFDHFLWNPSFQDHLFLDCLFPKRLSSNHFFTGSMSFGTISFWTSCSETGFPTAAKICSGRCRWDLRHIGVEGIPNRNDSQTSGKASGWSGVDEAAVYKMGMYVFQGRNVTGGAKIAMA